MPDEVLSVPLAMIGKFLRERIEMLILLTVYGQQVHSSLVDSKEPAIAMPIGLAEVDCRYFPYASMAWASLRLGEKSRRITAR
jgi:hypothetical protein